MMQTHYHNELGLWHFTRITRPKVKEIETNPNVVLVLLQKDTMQTVVVDAVCWIDRTVESKAKIFSDGIKQYGYTGPEDPKLLLLRYDFRRVTVHGSAKEIYECDPPQYDKDTQLFYKASTTHQITPFTTVDSKGVPHSRIMGGITFHPTLGFCFGTHESEKVKQIESNPHGIVTLYDEATTDTYTFEVLCSMVRSPMYRYALWSERMKAVGYTGPDDEHLIYIALTVQKAERVNIKEFWAQHSGDAAKKPAEPRKSDL
jgi:general stress protein 26